MSLARSVAEILAAHVAFEVECIDRVYGNVYQPRLQYAGGLGGYVHRHLWVPIASTAPLGKISERFVKQVHDFARQQQIPWVDFVKDQRKDDVMHEQLALEASGRSEGVVFIGRAQEKTKVFHTEKRRNPCTGRSYPWIVPSTGMPNHFYFYCLDDDFGPFFLKFCSYFPYNAKLCLLTELNREGPRRCGKISSDVATVRACDQRRAVPGPVLAGSAAARVAQGNWGSVRAVSPA